MMSGGAFIEGDHRYHLWRAWGPGNVAGRSVCWVMLNPSTADAETDDPTIRKCIGYAKRWGFGSIDVVNLYSYRATDPRALKSAPELNGPWSTKTIARVLCEYAGRVVYAWGTKGDQRRVIEVDGLVRGAGFAPQALRITKGGHPQHPLYLPYEIEPVPFILRAGEAS